eukprot:5913650-Alexandrium_andersonii.AAC.1
MDRQGKPGGTAAMRAMRRPSAAWARRFTTSGSASLSGVKFPTAKAIGSFFPCHTTFASFRFTSKRIPT